MGDWPGLARPALTNTGDPASGRSHQSRHSLSAQQPVFSSLLAPAQQPRLAWPPPHHQHQPHHALNTTRWKETQKYPINLPLSLKHKGNAAEYMPWYYVGDNGLVRVLIGWLFPWGGFDIIEFWAREGSDARCSGLWGRDRPQWGHTLHLSKNFWHWSSFLHTQIFTILDE